MQQLVYVMRGNPRAGGIERKYDCIAPNGHFTIPLRS